MWGRATATTAADDGPAGQLCPACTANNLLKARKCEVCGEPLRGLPGEDAHPKPAAEEPAEEDEALSRVAVEERESLGTFSSSIELEMAAGFLRSCDIAAEIGSPAPPNYTAGELWVRKADAAEARQLLAEAARNAPEGEDDGR